MTPIETELHVDTETFERVSRGPVYWTVPPDSFFPDSVRLREMVDAKFSGRWLATRIERRNIKVHSDGRQEATLRWPPEASADVRREDAEVAK